MHSKFNLHKCYSNYYFFLPNLWMEEMIAKHIYLWSNVGIEIYLSKTNTYGITKLHNLEKSKFLSVAFLLII